MKFLHIRNVGRFDRQRVELFGAGDKTRDDFGTIGHKRTGIKLAIIAAVRRGLELSILSDDARGQYCLQFSTEEVVVDGETDRRINFNYFIADKDGGQHQTQVGWHCTTSAFIGFDQPIGDDGYGQFAILRELLTNARDERNKGELIFEIVENVVYPPLGATSVYIEYTDVIGYILANSGRYFKWLAPSQLSLFEVPGVGAIYPKSELGMVRHFVQGVLVDAHREDILDSSIFDYSADEKTLVNEERRLASHGRFCEVIAKLFSVLDDPILIGRILEAVLSRETEFEQDVILRMDSLDDNISSIWRAVLETGILQSSKIAIASDIAIYDRDAEVIFGYKVLGQHFNAAKHLLRILGYKNVREVVPHANLDASYAEIPREAVDPQSLARLALVDERIAEAEPDLVFGIRFLKPLNEAAARLIGLCDLSKTSKDPVDLVVNDQHGLNSDIEALCATRLHEAFHRFTGKGDYDREFVNEILRRFAIHVLKNRT